MNAYHDLQAELRDGEAVEAIVFGDWGWGDWGQETPFVPRELRGQVLTLEQALPYMDGWSFNGGYGSPTCYAVTIWTDQRVFWVTQYDGATGLDSRPRNPVPGPPDMPGG